MSRGLRHFKGTEKALVVGDRLRGKEKVKKGGLGFLAARDYQARKAVPVEQQTSETEDETNVDNQNV